MANKEDVEFPIYPDLKDKVVFLTGIGQTGDPSMWGNGAAVARILSHNGAKIFGCDLNLEAAQHTENRIRAEGGNITVISADVTKDTSVKATVDTCIAKYGRIDILINNVGRSEPGGPSEMSEKIWDAQTDVNLKSVYLCCHHVLPLMEKQRSGTVVNVASVAALRYIGKPQATAVLYARKGIRLNVVVPGLMNTPLVGMLADKYAGGDLEGFKAKRNKAVPMGKMGESIDVAMTSAFLASQQSRYITGQKIVVDGGLTSSAG
ncbi:short-chain dehydrogenases/reductase [Penicillium riverlandense]|uniref:short-chain dehydrogenases/reductase n=1 Tax=Penicillium riverlandense TaxID=1903569 RepID=UPI0025497C63|nr:short-chain dehydrogenases/reductase [Penicillium riverlandense]KAJ5805367.1 short-chain dehydrogenases/reductase [Penicillium riverlandense]